jgi:hypothetical protein
MDDKTLQDRLDAIEKRLAAAEDIPGQVAQELAKSIRQLAERVDKHDELFPLVQQIIADFHEMTVKVRDRMAKRKPPPEPPPEPTPPSSDPFVN